MWKSKKIHYTRLWCPARNQTHNLIHPEFTGEQQQGQNTPGLNNLHLRRTQTQSEAGLWFLPLLEQGHRLKLRLDSTRLTPISTLAWESWRFYLFANSNCMNHILLKRVNFLFLISAFISAHTQYPHTQLRRAQVSHTVIALWYRPGKHILMSAIISMWFFFPDSKK